jgi:hypothetical protein
MMMADTAMTLFVYRCIQTNKRWRLTQQWHSLLTDAYKLIDRWWLAQQWHSLFTNEDKLTQQWHSLFTNEDKLTQQWHSSFKDENKLIDDDGWHSNDTLCLQM